MSQDQLNEWARTAVAALLERLERQAAQALALQNWRKP